MLSRFYNSMASDLGIDLGTASTLIYVKGQGLSLYEPSIVALNQKTGRVVAVGTDASQMIGRTPVHITAVQPLTHGIISNFEVAEEMMAYFLRQATGRTTRTIFRPRVVVGVPTGITNVERRAVRDALMAAGSRQVHIIEEPLASALGIRLPINEPVGNMIIDLGGGTADIAVISLGGIVQAKNINIAGDVFNQDITTYVRDEFKILIGSKTAEEIKIAIGSVIKEAEPLEAAIRGRDLISGLPREVVMTDADIREAIAESLNQFIETVKEVLESTPPEVVADVMHRGIILTGGGAVIRGLTTLLERELKIPIHLIDEPHTSVVRGAGVVLENLDQYQDILIDNEDELPPR